MTRSHSVPAEISAAVEVRATRSDLRKLRLVQVLVPIAVVLSPVARRLGSVLAAVPVALVAVTAVLIFFAARTSEITRLFVYAGRIKIGQTTLQAGETGRWRWHGRRATLFAPGGNVVIRARLPADADAVRVALQAALGPPLSYRRRGSRRARAVSLVVALAGLCLLSIGYVQHLVYLTPAVILVIVGFATFAALSGNVADTASPNRPG